MRLPRELGVADLEAFWFMLDNECKVSASTHNQALSSTLFLYHEDLCVALSCLG